MNIIIDRDNIFPQLPLNIEDRESLFECCIEDSARSRSIYVPPTRAEFEYIWSKYIFSNGKRIKITTKIDNSQYRPVEILEKINLKECINFNINPELRNKLICCTILASYNMIVYLNQTIQDYLFKKTLYFKRADSISILNEDDSIPSLARTRVSANNQIRSVFDHRTTICLVSGLFEKFYHNIYSNDTNWNSFWSYMSDFYILNSIKFEIEKNSSVISLLENKSYRFNLKKDFLQDKYQQEDDQSAFVSKEYIIKYILNNPNISKQTLLTVKKIIESQPMENNK